MPRTEAPTTSALPPYVSDRKGKERRRSQQDDSDTDDGILRIPQSAAAQMLSLMLQQHRHYARGSQDDQAFLRQIQQTALDMGLQLDTDELANLSAAAPVQETEPSQVQYDDDDFDSREVEQGLEIERVLSRDRTDRLARAGLSQADDSVREYSQAQENSGWGQTEYAQTADTSVRVSAPVPTYPPQVPFPTQSPTTGHQTMEGQLPSGSTDTLTARSSASTVRQDGPQPQYRTTGHPSSMPRLVTPGPAPQEPTRLAP